MKTSIYLTIVLITISFFSANCQTEIGIRGGTMLTNWYGYVDVTADVNYKMKPGGFLGVGVKLPISKRVEFHIGTDISMKGHVISGSIKDGRDFITGNISTTSIYLDTPASINIFVDDQFYLKGGGIFSTLLSNTYSVDLDVNGTPVQDSEGANDALYKQDFSYLLGLGFKTSKGINIELTYESSFNNIISDTNYFTWYEARNKVLRAGISYYFDRSK